EGTSSDGNRVMPFKTALFAAAGLGPIAETGTDDTIFAQTLALAYTHRHGLPLGRRGRSSVAWFGDKELASHAWTVLKGGPLDVHVKIGEPLDVRHFQNRKVLALYSERRVREDVMSLRTARG
ncbi:MAG: lysophospholipid acyltransferase family protein, partial [Methyloligellaceae bacterium]